MEYVFGTDDRRGRRILRTKGEAHTDLYGFCEVVREYNDCTITDNFYAVRKIRSDEDDEGVCYDWYEIDLHYRTVDKTKASEISFTDAHLESIAQGQKQTDLELSLLEQGQYTTEKELEGLENV